MILQCYICEAFSLARATVVSRTVPLEQRRQETCLATNGLRPMSLEFALSQRATRVVWETNPISQCVNRLLSSVLLIKGDRCV